MRYVRVEMDGVPRWGVIRDGEVLTLHGTPYEELVYDGGAFPLEGCRLLAPCAPTKIVCVGKNYADHARELGSEPPGFPVLFLKGPNTLNRPDGEVHAPGFVGRLDYEGELALVIRRKAKDIKAADFADYILGYTCLNDITARDVQQHDGQWTRAKSMDGFCPIGPWIETELDPSDLRIQTRLNGEVKQDSRTSKLIFSLGRIVEHITAFTTLLPGDVIATGTPE